MNLFDATDIADAALPARWFRRLLLLIAVVVAILLATPLLSVEEVGAWTYAQAQAHVHEMLDPIVADMLESLQSKLPATTTTTTLSAVPPGL